MVLLTVRTRTGTLRLVAQQIGAAYRDIHILSGCERGIALKGRAVPPNLLRAAGIAVLTACCTVVDADEDFHMAVPPERVKSPPHTVLLVQPEVIVKQLTTGDLEETAQDWSREASENAARLMRALVKKSSAFEVVDDGVLTPTEKASLQQYSALYVRLMTSIAVSRESKNPVWRNRVARFDYTVGPGINGVAARANADAALFIVGMDHVSSAGRSARAAGGILLGILTGVYRLPKAGTAFLSLGMVDLRSGDLLWVSGDYGGGAMNLRKEKDMNKVLSELFESYPWQPKSADKDNGK